MDKKWGGYCQKKMPRMDEWNLFLCNSFSPNLFKNIFV